MPLLDPSLLPIVARLDEVQSLTDTKVEKVTNAITSVVGREDRSAAAVGDVPCADINIFTGTDQDVFNKIARTLCLALTGLTQGASDAVGALLARASDDLNNVLDGISNLVTGLTDTIRDTLNSVIETITEQLDKSLRAIVGAVEGVVARVSDFVAGVIETVDQGIREVLEFVGLRIAGLVGAVGEAFEALLGAAGVLVNRIDTLVRDVAEFLVQLASSTLEAMSRTIAAVLGPLVGAGQSVLARLGDLVEAVPGAVRVAAEALTEGLGKFVGDPLGKIGSIFVTQVEEFFGALIEEGNLSQGEILRILLPKLGADPDTVEKIAVAVDDATPSTPGFTAAALAFLIPLVLAQFIGASLEPVATQLQQEIAGSTRQALISPLDLLDGLFKGDISAERFQEDFEQAGFSEARINSLIATFRHAPDVSVQIQAWLRGLIEDNELNDALAANRMRGNDIELLKQIVFFVPPAQDLIRMAVREVFSPEVRERFGQDQDFPEEFAKFAVQQGISDEWARAYWAAHWALPSPAQGFEMLHRGVIEVEDLDVLLRALDVMPFWRDKLTQIAFSPLTRVDLRRMHALGMLTDKELQTRYEAIGFDADNASLMVAFTAAFNASDEELPDELEGLTRATVLNLFEDGLVDRDEAVALLAGMGIGSDAAELFVEQRELELQRGERRDLIESIVALAGGGRISLPQAEDSLAQLGITAIEATRAVVRILGKRADRDRLPSLADLLKMRNAAIIDDEVYLDTIQASGFDDEWAGRVFELNTGEAPA